MENATGNKCQIPYSDIEKRSFFESPSSVLLGTREYIWTHRLFSLVNEQNNKVLYNLWKPFI